MAKKIKIHNGEWFDKNVLMTEETIKKEPIQFPFLYTCLDQKGNILFHVLEEKK